MERIKDLYQLMVEQCIEYKLYSRKIQHQYNNNGIKFQSPRFPVLEGYQIVYLKKKDKYLCLKSAQTAQQREELLASLNYNDLHFEKGEGE